MKRSVDAAIEKLKAQIADVQRAIDALEGVSEPEAAKPTRGRPKKKGLPVEPSL